MPLPRPTATTPPALTLTGLYQHVAGRTALADLTLTLPAGEWLLICGPNGAGKSLLSRLILGLDRPSAGTIALFGQELERLDSGAMHRLRRRLGAVLQGGSLLADRSVLENLLLPLRETPLRRTELARAARLVVTLLRLDGLEHHDPRALSLGQRRRVELARALIHQPDLLVWDGVADGLDPSALAEILEMLDTVRRNRALTLIATDNTPAALATHCERALVLDHGRAVYAGPTATLREAATDRLELRAALRGWR
ncbi:cell division ATP-binding protein FtsE [Marichromatium bheemlicum]|uniref:ABC transporter ATP-binding protein n=1 Tax=Marichromatium bheemlicum TaxID=365339 RepID=A0ABX1IAM5_9GAMM|nr:ABC transporter ATP-binding protein [Marichromatium bheemlicum]NKN34584.1 ABC transporter ATP-binding protein [Marichromatium bheemlicum]